MARFSASSEKAVPEKMDHIVIKVFMNINVLILLSVAFIADKMTGSQRRFVLAPSM